MDNRQVTPLFFDPHVCDPPSTSGRTEMAAWECGCGRHWHLEWFRLLDGRMAGPSWILERRYGQSSRR